MAVVCSTNGPELYTGCVIDEFEVNMAYDSYWYAVCWDEDAQDVVQIEYATTAFGGCGYCKIDATKETLGKVFDFYLKKCAEKFDSEINEEEAKAYGKEDSVEVIRGRKVKKGSVGTCFWLGETYNSYSHQYEKRAGIEVDGERFFVPAEYLVSSNWRDKLLVGDDRDNRIHRMAVQKMPRRYRYFFLKGGAA